MTGTAMPERASRTRFVEVAGGRIAYDEMGHGPLVVLSPGMADIRSTYRFLAPLITAGGYRVASVDLRAHGESSTGWPSYTHQDTADDLLAVIENLGAPAVIVGQSFSGGATTLAAVTKPDLVRAVVEIAPFTRPPRYSLSAFVRNDHNYRRGALLLMPFALRGSLKAWSKYLGIAYPGRKPADWNSWLSRLQENLREPGRMEAAQKMVSSRATLKKAAAELPNVPCRVLVVMGSNDSDFPNPEAEAKALVGLLPPGLGDYKMIENAGHYPHAQYPQEVADVVLPFLAEVANA